MDSDNLKDWLVATLTILVEKPDEIEVEKTTDEQGVLYTVKVAEGDRGRVIGRKGAIASAMRTLLRSAGYIHDIRASMKIDIPGSNFVPRDGDENLQRPEDRT